MIGSPVNADNLNNVMEFDVVIRVHADGSYSLTDEYAPTVTDGELDSTSSPWSLIRNRSGQYGYTGPSFHESEYVGGGLARDILLNPGLYVAVIDRASDPHHDEDESFRDEWDEHCDTYGCDHDVIGWSVAYQLDDGSVF